MLKKICLFSFVVLISFVARAQSADSVYSKYLDFNLARFQGETEKLLSLGEAILPAADKLPEKTRINFYFAIGQVYENNDQPQKALGYYEKVAAAVPDYYVAHRGIGYIYLAQANEIGNKMHAATDAAVNNQLMADYEKMVRKALPHLEKAQACDPSDETLDAIKTLYKNLKDTEGLNSLNARLKQLSAHCIDLLEDK
jgi:tetratricopeptide (TPR) repeat protein